MLAGIDYGPQTTALPPPVWTEKRVELLKALWHAGQLSAAGIANELGVSRNAVIGKAHRIGLVARNTRPQSAPRKPRLSRATRPPAWMSVLTPPLLQGSPEAAIDMAPDDTEPTPRIVPLIALTADDCRWPSGEGATLTFCGHPICAGKYCGFHYRKAHAPKYRRA